MIDCQQRQMAVSAIRDGWAGGHQKWGCVDTGMNMLHLEAMRRNIPLPKVYVQETQEGNFIVLKGSEIISTCLHYLNDPESAHGFLAHYHRSVLWSMLDIVVLRCTMTDEEIGQVMRMVSL